MREEIKQALDQTIAEHSIVLFMKGERTAPQCGFSASVVDILDSLVDSYATVNVLADPEIREGIKVYSEWPTIPQLYVNGEFVGGADIIKDMFASGALQKSLGVEAGDITPPNITITDEAAKVLAAAHADEPGHVLFLAVSPRFEHHLGFGPAEANTLQVEHNGITLHIDMPSVRRVDGLSLDFVDGPAGQGFKIDNPNAPKSVKQLSVEALNELLQHNATVYLFDVRTEQERQIAKIDGAQLLDAAAEELIASLPKDTPLVFHCHHGGRSQAAAEHFLQQGFKDVANVAGGIDAWSSQIDPTVPRY